MHYRWEIKIHDLQCSSWTDELPSYCLWFLSSVTVAKVTANSVITWWYLLSFGYVLTNTV